MSAIQNYICIFSSVLLIVVQLNAVTVNPALCPTNKIAPHRRHADEEDSGPRTFGLIHGLFGPSRRPQKPTPYNDLEEPPQDDDQEDCGEIDDYDETDLSSLTPGGQKKKQNRNDRYFFGNNYVNSPQHHYPEQNQYPQSQYRPQRPTRPPYNFEGNYGSNYNDNNNNYYRPQSNYYPSNYNNIKPVQEDYQDNPQSAYRPGIIGGALGHIVGYPTYRPTTEETIRRKQSHHVRFPNNDAHINRRRGRSQQSHQTHHSPSILGTFFDLFH